MFCKSKCVFLLLFFLNVISYFAHSQTPEIDSLNNVLKTAKEDTLKVNTLQALCIALQNSSDLQGALRVEQQTLALAQQLDWPKAVAKAYNRIGVIEMNTGNYTEAQKNFFASLAIREKSGDRKGVSASNSNIGIIYFHQGNYPAALKYNLASLKIKEKLGDKQGIANSYNNIGTIYQNQGNYSEALKNYFA